MTIDQCVSYKPVHQYTIQTRICELRDLRGKSGLFRDFSWTLVPIGTKSRNRDLKGSTAICSTEPHNNQAMTHKPLKCPISRQWAHACLVKHLFARFPTSALIGIALMNFVGRITGANGCYGPYATNMGKWGIPGKSYKPPVIRRRSDIKKRCIFGTP